MEDNKENKKNKELVTNTGQKLSYEELSNIAHQLSEQSRNLHKQLQESNLSNYFTRIDFLFSVIKNPNVFDPRFVIDCAKEIEAYITDTRYVKKEDDKVVSKESTEGIED